MTLYFIGMGPSIEYLSLKAIAILKSVDKVVVDRYTSIVPDYSIDRLREIIGCKPVIVEASRSDLEGWSIKSIVEEAIEKDIALLVPGDPFIATTHDAIRLEALKKGVDVEVVYGVSVYCLVASASGLQAYRFGKSVTLVYPEGFKPYSVLETIYDNLKRGLHTLLFLDLKIDKGVAMTIPEAIDLLLSLDREYSSNPILDRVIGVGLAQIGTDRETVRADILSRLSSYEYPEPPHSLVIVAKPHPIELELLHYIGKLPLSVFERYTSCKSYP